MRIIPAVFGLASQIFGCEGGNAEAEPRIKESAPQHTLERADAWWKEKPSPKVVPAAAPKISACTKYQFEETHEVCRRGGNTDMVSCRDVTEKKSGAVCSDPQNNLEAAQQALNLKLLERGKLFKAFQEEAGARTVKFCADIDWDRTGRGITTIDRKFNSETIPLIHHEREKICGEGAGLDAAQTQWEQNAIQFAKEHTNYRYRNATLQKIVEDLLKEINIK